jgi:hypothetical protein
METERAFNVVDSLVSSKKDKFLSLAWASIRKELVEEKFTPTNIASPKLLDSLNNISELLRIGNYSTAEMCVNILIKQLRANG